MSLRLMVLLFLAAFAIFATARLPMSTALALSDDIAARRVEGTIWRGRLEGAVLFGRRIGDVSVQLSAWPLMLGRLGIDWSLADGPLAGSGTLVRRPGGALLVRDTSLAGPLSALFPAGRMAGGFHAEIGEILIDAGGCRRATGRLWSDARPQGEISCDGDTLVLPLKLDSGEGVFDLRLLVRRGWRFEVGLAAP